MKGGATPSHSGQSAGLDPGALAGSLFALGAYGVWGIAPLYFRWIDEFTALQIVAHRVLWSALLLLSMVLMMGGWSRLVAVVRRPSSLAWLTLSGWLIGCNWLLFIYAVVSDRVLEASLGYFINPLVSVVLGVLFLGERLRPLPAFAVLIAALGVGNEMLHFGSMPWLGLALAFSFGFYGLIRKRLGVDAFTGLTVETWLLLPLALGWLVWQASLGEGLLPETALDLGKLFLVGPLTMLPLLCFAAAANRLSLGALGFFQYLAPSLQFILAVWVFGEPFASTQWWTFGLIWLALALFSVAAIDVQRRRRLPVINGETRA